MSREKCTIHFLLYQLVYGYGVEKFPIINFTRVVPPSYAGGIDFQFANQFLNKAPNEQVSTILEHFGPKHFERQKLKLKKQISDWLGTKAVQLILKFLKTLMLRPRFLKTVMYRTRPSDIPGPTKKFEHIAEKKLHMNYMDGNTKKPATKYIPYYTDKTGSKQYLPFKQDVSDPQYYIYTMG